MLSILALIATCAAGRSASPLPHLIHIVMDDVGWNDLGYVNNYTTTPVIDHLATNGIQLSRFYTFKECAPSRGSMLTGRYPFHFGYYRNPNDEGGVPVDFTLLPRVLKDQGYRTHAIGKWHVGFQTKEHTPTYRGFDTFLGYYHWGEGYFNHEFPPAYKGDVKCRGVDLTNNTGEDLRPFGRANPAVEDVYSMELFVDEAKRVISQHPKDEPLYMYVAFQNVHDPYQVPQALIDRVNPAIVDPSRRNFTAMLLSMDEGIGKVVEALQDAGLYDNALLWFNSDNGGELPYDTTKFEAGGGTGNNFPLKGGKFSLWEGSMRARAFVSGPLVPERLRGTEHSGLAHTSDIFPTFAALAGVPFDEIVDSTGPIAIDGYDLSEQILRNASINKRKEILHQPLGKYWDGSCLAGDLTNMFQPSCGAAITRWPYKLIHGYAGDNRTVPFVLNGYRQLPTGLDPMHLRAGAESTLKVDPPADAPCVASPCLFDLSVDPSETEDIAAQHPQLVQELNQSLYDYGATGPEPQPGSDDSTPSDKQCESVERHGAWVPDWNSELGDYSV